MGKGILETLVGVLARPTSTIRSICQQRPIGWAIIVYLVASLVSTVAMIELGLLEEMGLTDVGMTVILVGSPIIGIVTLVIATALCHLAASVLGDGGRGSYGGLFSGFGFAALPGILPLPWRSSGCYQWWAVCSPAWGLSGSPCGHWCSAFWR